MDNIAKDIYNMLEGNTSYDLYLNYSKFAFCVLTYTKKDKDIYDELGLHDTKKIIASLRIAWTIEKLGPGILKSLTSVPVSHWAKLKNSYWNEIQKELQEGEKFSAKWTEHAREMVNNYSLKYFNLD